MAVTAGAILLVEGSTSGDRAISLPSGVTLIGRAPMNDIVVDMPGVSRMHANIRGDSPGYWLQDLDSSQGTFVNGNRIEGEGQRLRDKDRIQLGGRQDGMSWVFREDQATKRMSNPSEEA